MLFSELTPSLQAHWTLHLNALKADYSSNPTIVALADAVLASTIAVPQLEEPSYVHIAIKKPTSRHYLVLYPE